MEIEIRNASKSEYPRVLQMIHEFAAYQRTPEKVSITLEQMERDENLFRCLVVVVNKKVIGFATYYFAYSSWSGKSLYLDDLYLEEEYRDKNLGSEVMDHLEMIAKENECQKMRWLVSKWNESAIRFYKRRGAVIYDTEFTCEQDLWS